MKDVWYANTYMHANVYMCVENVKRHQQSSTQVLHVRSKVWHTMHIDVDLIGPLPELLHAFLLHCSVDVARF